MLYGKELCKLILCKLGADDAKSSCIIRSALTDICFSGNHIEIDPLSIAAFYHAFGSQHHSIRLISRQSIQDLLDLFFRIDLYSLPAPACKDFICMMVAMVVMVMIVAALLVIMMMILIVMVVAAFLMVVMMMVMITFLMVVMVMIVVTFLMVMVIMIVIALFMIMMVMMSAAYRAGLLLHQFLFQRSIVLHSIQDLLS